MKHLETIEFTDPTLPIKIIPNRQSTVNKIDNSSCAFHEALEIKYFFEGESTLLIGSDTVRAVAGDVIVINPYEFHATLDYGNTNKGKYHLFMIGLDFFEGHRCSDVNLRYALLEKRIVLNTKISNTVSVSEILKRLIEKGDNRDAKAKLLTLGLVAELFSELLTEAHIKDTDTKPSEVFKYYAVIEPALRMIRDDFSNKFTVDDFAEACNVSKYHFCRIFKSVMGMGSIQYLNSFRLRIADAFLKNTSLSISEIADRCGFEDVNYFSRIYKSTFGTPPKKSKLRIN